MVGHELSFSITAMVGTQICLCTSRRPLLYPAMAAHREQEGNLHFQRRMDIQGQCLSARNVFYIQPWLGIRIVLCPVGRPLLYPATAVHRDKNTIYISGRDWVYKDNAYPQEYRFLYPAMVDRQSNVYRSKDHSYFHSWLDMNSRFL